MGTKNNPGQFDCYANAEPDEPMFVLLGRDRHAEVLTRLWAILRAHDGEDEEKIAEAIQCANNMERWGDGLGKYRLNGAKTFGDGEWEKDKARPSSKVVEQVFFAATKDLDEHPDGFDHSCQCQTCLSYGD